jgi:hypothetical protein
MATRSCNRTFPVTWYVQVSTAARELRTNATNVDPLLAKGELSGLVVDGRWLVEKRSVEKLRAKREREARPAPVR